MYGGRRNGIKYLQNLEFHANVGREQSEQQDCLLC